MDAALDQTLGGAVANAGDDQDGDLPLDEIEDIAVTIGRVVGIHGSVLWGTLYDDEDNTAASAARMGALVSLRGPESRVFGVVNALRRERDGGGSERYQCGCAGNRFQEVASSLLLLLICQIHVGSFPT